MNTPTVPTPAPLDPPYRTVANQVRDHAQARPDQPALVQGDEVITYGQLDGVLFVIG